MSQMSSPPPAVPSAPSDPSDASSAAAVRPMGPGGTLLVFLLAGLIAGGGSLGIVLAWHDFFRISPEFENISMEDQEATARLVAAEADAARKNLLLTLGAAGAVLGSVMGLAGGIRDRSVARCGFGILLGLILGSGLGVAAAYLGPGLGSRIEAGTPGGATFESRQNWKLFATIAVHSICWGALGVAAALAATIPSRRIPLIVKNAVGAFVTAMLAMMIYHVLLANFVQLSRFEVLLPQDAVPIAMWTIPTCLMLGFCIGRLSLPQRQTTA